MRPQESQNKTLPSHVPAQSPASSPSPAAVAVADDSGSAQAPDPELVEFLANHGINGTSRDELASLPGLTVPLVRRIFAKLSGDAGPGLKVNAIRATAPDLIVKTRQDAERKQAERDCTQRDAAELQPLADALYAALPDDERQRVEDTVRRNTNRADTDERVLRSGVAEYVAVYQVKCDKTPDLKQAIEVFTKRRDELKHAPRVRSGAASQLAQTLRPEADPPIHEQKTELIRQAAASAGVKPRA
jgi:hypothetical protein